MQNDTLDTLRMVQDALDLYAHCEHPDTNVAPASEALPALDALIARMEQNTGTSGMAGDAADRKDADSGHGPDASVCRLSPAPAASDVEALVGKIQALPSFHAAGMIEKPAVIEAIRAHFNAAAGEKE